jgi:hypothetical protein
LLLSKIFIFIIFWPKFNLYVMWANFYCAMRHNIKPSIMDDANLILIFWKFTNFVTWQLLISPCVSIWTIQSGWLWLNFFILNYIFLKFIKLSHMEKIDLTMCIKIKSYNLDEIDKMNFLIGIIWNYVYPTMCQHVTNY